MDTLIEAGKIVKPVGFKGRLKVYSYIESPEILESLDEVVIEHPNADRVQYHVKGIRIKGRTFLLDTEGIDGEMAQSLVGCSLFMFSDKLKPLPNGEYYWKDIIGLHVYTDQGEPLGVIDRIIPTGSNDVYVCTDGERELLLPAISDVIKSIDTVSGTMAVTLIEGIR